MYSPVADILDGEHIVDVVHGVGGVDERQHGGRGGLVAPEGAQPAQHRVQLHALAASRSRHTAGAQTTWKAEATVDPCGAERARVPPSSLI